MLSRSLDVCCRRGSQGDYRDHHDSSTELCEESTKSEMVGDISKKNGWQAGYGGALYVVDGSFRKTTNTSYVVKWSLI